jgi:hypothetical protein
MMIGFLPLLIVVDAHIMNRTTMGNGTDLNALKKGIIIHIGILLLGKTLLFSLMILLNVNITDKVCCSTCEKKLNRYTFSLLSSSSCFDPYVC